MQQINFTRRLNVGINNDLMIFSIDLRFCCRKMTDLATRTEHKVNKILYFLYVCDKGELYSMHLTISHFYNNNK